MIVRSNKFENFMLESFDFTIYVQKSICNQYNYLTNDVTQLQKKRQQCKHPSHRNSENIKTTKPKHHKIKNSKLQKSETGIGNKE